MPDIELLSVVIPVYNAAKFLADAIHSIQEQRHPRLEIIVVDDGSTDRSMDVARSFHAVRCLRQENSGIAAARNAGIKQASGSLLAFLDADDMWTAGKLSLQLAALHANPEAAFICGAVEQFLDDPKLAASHPIPPPTNSASAGTILIRTRDFLRVGLFNPTLRIGEFIDWYSRARNLGLQEHQIDKVVLRRRIHGQNTTLRRRDSTVDYLSVLKAHLDRKRRAA
jgi:glycosyltransferase involved in cell wall biosynthesis